MATAQKYQNPYIGPRAFEREDEQYFFGRDREVNDLISMIISHRVVLLYAQSGAGKTSLLNAKLLPRLKKMEGFEVFPVARVRAALPEGIRPENIENIFAFNTLMTWSEGGSDGQRMAQMKLSDFLQDRPHRTNKRNFPLPRLLTFDQFEELFTNYPERWVDKAKFFDQVNEALESDKLLRILFVIREDFLGKLDPYANLLPDGFRCSFRLECLRQDAASDAIQEPLKGTDRYFAEGVAANLIKQLATIRTEGMYGVQVETAGEYVEPVQLQVVCQSLWNNLPPDAREITSAHLEKYGDVTLALQEFYEKALKAVQQKTGVKEDMLRGLFEYKLITSFGTRGPVSRGTESTEGIPNLAIDELENQHIIRSEARAGGVHWYELTHDRLIEPIRKSNESWKRAFEMRKLRHAHRLSWFLALALLVAGASFYLYRWAYIKEDVSYYSNYVEQWGLPKGVGKELSFKQVQHRPVSYMIVRKGSQGPVLKMITVNSNDRPTPYHTIGTHLEEDSRRNPFRECRYEYSLDKDGKIVNAKAFDKDSILVWTRVYLRDQFNKLVERVYYVDPNGQILSKPHSAAELNEILYTPEGYESRICYFDRNGNPQRGLDNAYGRQKEFDSLGRMTKTVSLSRDGKTPMIDDAGNAILECKYDSEGNLSQQAAFDVAGKATYFKDGYHRSTYTYDTLGRTKETAYFDTVGKRTLNGNWIHRIIDSCNDHGNIEIETYLDTAGNPILIKEGYAYIKSKYDSLGNVIGEYFMDTNKISCFCKEGYASIKTEYDSAGNRTRWTFYDIEGNTTNCTQGYASYNAKFDKRGHSIEVSYRSISGRLIKPSKAEAAGWKNEYDNRGREIRRIFLGTGNSDLSGTAPYYAGWMKTYNQQGEEIDLTLLDDYGKPFYNSNYGYSRRRREFDADANMISESYYDKRNLPIKVKSLGYAKLRAEYNKEGIQIRESYYDIKDKPDICANGFSRWERIDTTGGREVWWRYQDKERKPFKNSDGYVGECEIYDDHGNKIRVIYLDADNKPVIKNGGYSSITWDYNNRGKLTLATYYDTNNKRTPSKNGYAGWRNEYDMRGNVVLQTYLGTQGQPISPKQMGYASLVWEYNKRGDNTSETYLNLAGKRVMNSHNYAGWKNEYDKRGNVVLSTYFGTRDETVKPNNDYAIVRRKYDRLGNLVYKVYAGVDGKPVKSSDGYAIVTADYDQQGNQIKKSYYDKDSVAFDETLSEFNKDGNLISQEYFGRHKKPKMLPDGYSMWKAEYDSQGNQIKISHYRGNKIRTMIKDNYFQLEREFNTRNQLIMLCTYDTNNKLVVNSYGFAKVIRTYDKSGYLNEITSYGADGKLKVAKCGYARISILYDKNGNPIEESYFGANGKPILYNNAYARLSWEYDEWGNIIEESYFGIDGGLKICWVNNIVNAARWTASYDATGNVIERRYYDARNQLVLVR
ncbi:MAG: ATP-binding protein [Bacteroidota bacterium]